jgi:anaerobic magnesium-protoporphyrin IX monomethyl ester cyclase
VRVLLVDLNNFSRYPTLGVGILAAVLRRGGVEVEVLSPLARGVSGYPRLTRARPWGEYEDRLRYWSAVTPATSIRRLRNRLAHALRPVNLKEQQAIVAYAEEMIARCPDVVLLSTYTMYEDTCAALAELCRNKGIPVIVGGNYFVDPRLVERWARIPGISAVFGGEPETDLVRLVTDLAAGHDVSSYPGVTVPGGPVVDPAPPLLGLDQLPFPDYRDFPWDRYPNRIVPIMTGRGCQWSRCRFCADVITSAGRGYRSRSLQNVLDELRLQHSRHAATLFALLDLKLNSSIPLWRGLIEGFQMAVPGAAWTASVHVDLRDDNGLSQRDLSHARRAGLVRITTGLETGSARLMKRMAKGTSPERTAEFVRHASEAGISVRLTAMTGFPGEEPGDLDETSRFLSSHSRWIERVMLNRFTLMMGSEVERSSVQRPDRSPSLHRKHVDPLNAVVEHDNAGCASREHRRAVYRLLGIVHRINRRPLTASAREFEGVM